MGRESALAVATGSQPAPAAPVQTTAVAPAPQGVVVPIKPEAVASEPALESTHLAGMAKREEKLVTEQLALKTEREAVAKLKAEVDAKLAPFEKFHIERAKDPVAAMKSLGFSEEDIFNFLASSEKKEPTLEERSAAAAQAVIDKARAEDAAKAQQAKAEANTRIINRFQGQIGKFVEDPANAEAFEYVQHYGKMSEAQIYENVTRVLLDTGELISIKEAAQMTEDLYKFEHEGIETKRAARKKPTEPEAVPPPAVTQPKVVTNAARPTVAAVIDKPETREQKKARIIEAIRQNGLRK